MTDWRAIIRARLVETGLLSREPEEQIGELSGHIEDLAEDAVHRGSTHEEAARRALCEETDWDALARGIALAQQEETMNDRVRRIWLPGATMTAFTYTAWWALGRFGLEPIIFWLTPKSVVFFFVPWLLLLPVVGAAGSYWSRRGGGGAGEAMLAGLFPAVVMCVFLLVALVMAMVADPQVRPPVKLWAFTLGVMSLVVVPAIALCVGTLPFLRKRATA